MLESLKFQTGEAQKVDLGVLQGITELFPSTSRSGAGFRRTCRWFRRRSLPGELLRQEA
jgi:hypothetical protein